MQVLIVGCGNIGAALAAGYADQVSTARVVAVAPHPEQARRRLPHGSQVQVVPPGEPLPAGFEPQIVVIAVKPRLVTEVTATYRRFASAAIFVSVAAGVGAESVSRALASPTGRVLRAMPNMPIALKQGMTVLWAPEHATIVERSLVEGLFASVGRTAWVRDEATIDVATAVSGSGPAYLYAFIDQFRRAAEAAGLPADLAEHSARQTVLGAAAIVAHSELSPLQLIDTVRTPGGTTEAAMVHLEGEGGLSGILTRGIQAAIRRAEDLRQAY